MLRNIINLVITIVWLIPASAMALDGIKAEVLPSSVVQGDPFVVRLTGDFLHAPPTGAFNGNTLLFTPCGADCYQAVSLAPIPMRPGKYDIKVSCDNRMSDLAVTIVKGKFAAQSLTLPPDKVNLSPEDEARADAETAMLKQLWKVKSPKLWEGSFIMPLSNTFSTAFGVRRTINKNRLSIHSGVDIRGAMGAPARAANSGVVVVAQELFFGGNTMVLDHGQGIYTVYMHLSEFIANLHEVVDKGQVIGLVGSTGRSTGPHLHYTVKINGSNANPSSMASLPLLENTNNSWAALPVKAKKGDN